MPSTTFRLSKISKYPNMAPLRMMNRKVPQRSPNGTSGDFFISILNNSSSLYFLTKKISILHLDLLEEL